MTRKYMIEKAAAYLRDRSPHAAVVLADEDVRSDQRRVAGALHALVAGHVRRRAEHGGVGVLGGDARRGGVHPGVRRARALGGRAQLDVARRGQLFAVDGSSYFSRPGPRVIASCKGAGLSRASRRSKVARGPTWPRWLSTRRFWSATASSSPRTNSPRSGRSRTREFGVGRGTVYACSFSAMWVARGYTASSGASIPMNVSRNGL